MKPDVRQLVDEIRYTWTDAGIAMTLSRMRETDAGAVRGMLQVEAIGERRNGNGGQIYWAMVTLTTNSDRKTVVAKLDRAAPVNGGWETDVDRTFQDAWERYTHVPAPIVLADLSDDEIETAFQFFPILPAGQIALLLADQGSTKSYLMEYLGICTAGGHPSIFGPPLKQGPVLFYDWEVDERVARRRMRWICSGMGVQVPRDFLYVNMAERGRLLDCVREMRYQIARHKAPLVIIDSLTFATGGDLNSPEYAAPTMSAIGSLGDGVTKLISAHPNKRDRNAGADEVSVIGSGLFEFRARAIWLMKREQRRTSRFGVSMVPRKPFDGLPPTNVAYRMVFDNAAHAAHFEPLKLADAPELEASTLSLPERIHALLARRGKLSTLDIADALGSKPELVKVACNRMPDVFPFATGGGRGNATVWGLSEANATDDTPPWWNR